ncbi:hypothetical protein [Microbacterium testaceum]|uniref:hypothetical protein n=1 Tax=Microbacterium testaceum TaxID=2033 RepID=UPI0022E8B260|nr:hypothetical protein [Microbacterium testaceum]
MPTTTPAGWYPVDEHTEQWWDGSAWGDARRPAMPQALSGAAWPLRPNPLGVVALISAILGFVFACWPGALVVGWVLLPVALLLSVVATCLPNRAKRASITALVVSIVGTVAGIAVFAGVVSNAFTPSANPASAPSSAPVDAAEPAAAEPPADEAPSEPTTTNPRGNVSLGFGDAFEADGVTMVIHGATFDPTCTSSVASPPDNGHFLVLDVSASTSPSAQSSPFNVFYWSWVDDAGQTMGGNITSGATFFCLDGSSAMPDLGPGQNGSGKIVLDVNSLNGTLIYRSPFEESGREWSIQLAQ